MGRNIKGISREMDSHLKVKGKLHLKQNYLIAYNLLQTILYGNIFLNLISTFFQYGEPAQYMAFEMTGKQMMVCQILSVLEIIHPMLGLFKTSVKMSAAQVIGRNYFLFLLMLREPRLQNSPICWYTFIVWSGIEIIRYPFYLIDILEIQISSWTWLRYTAWMLFYPTGILLEGLIEYRSLTYFAETGIYSIGLPNPANFAFYFPYFLKVHSIIFITVATINMKYMYKKRQKQLCSMFRIKRKAKSAVY